jgi:RNA polymerase sigma-70 factor (ECF subfamily)
MTQSAGAVALPGTYENEVADLVIRARSGEHQAFGTLVERSWSELVTLARGILAADADAEDIVQEALVHAWTRLWMLRRPERFGAWMRRIVARRCLSHARRSRPLRRSGELAEVPASGATPDAGLDTARLLSTLAPRQRAVLYLTWMEGCTDREAGRILGLRAATVRVHRHRGLKRLQHMVEEQR